MTLTDFLLARIAEDEAAALDAAHVTRMPQFGDNAGEALLGLAESEGADPAGLAHFSRHTPARVLAECEAKRRIVEQHKAWPVLAESPPTFEQADGDLDSVVFRASKQMAWLTEQEYRARFGSEPPTAPMIRTLAAIYADHPDYREEWRP